MKRLAMAELQADEMQTIVGGKEQSIWVFAVIEVWSRLRPSTIIGKRSFRNTLALFRDVFEPDDSPVGPFDCDGWIQILRESHRVRGDSSRHCVTPRTLRN
jgi:hypothetical protein